MGSFGRGYNGPKRQTVEDGLTLSLSQMGRKEAFRYGYSTKGQWFWRYPGNEPHATIDYQCDMTDAEHAVIRLTYKVDGQSMDHVVRLERTSVHNGEWR